MVHHCRIDIFFTNIIYFISKERPGFQYHSRREACPAAATDLLRSIYIHLHIIHLNDINIAYIMDIYLVYLVNIYLVYKI